jgi:hypothetical protein
MNIAHFENGYFKAGEIELSFDGHNDLLIEAYKELIGNIYAYFELNPDNTFERYLDILIEDAKA